MNKENRIKELIEKLNFYTKYYDMGQPKITDKKWDSLYFELQALENETGIYLPDSPTQSINYQVVNQLNKVKHNHLMLSLNKTKSIDEIKSFIGNKDYICMAKMDGLTCSLRYLDGKLVSAETRGNGIEGEDILHNALVVKNIPKKINYKEELIVDGEIICTYKDFKPFENEYKNPRNFASGSIRLLNSKESSARNLTFVAWDCVKGREEDMTLDEKLRTLRCHYGFTTVPCIYKRYFNFRNDINTLQMAIEIVKGQSQELGYPIDGAVFKYNKCDEYDAAGKTDHHFKGGLAYKFYDEEYETTLRDIEFTMGRTGKLTPVAIFDTIDISGTEVTRANLHNLSIVKEILNKPFKGQKIWVIKSNEIIPMITRAEEDDDKVKKYIDIYPICPICHEPTEIVKENESEVLYCSNTQCEGRLLNRIEHFFSKRSGINAKGLSKATIEKLIEWEWINSISDMFNLEQYKKEWIKKSGFGEKSVSNILQAIKDSCNCDLESVISAAGIPLIGRAVARDIVKVFPTYNQFKEAITEDFDFSSLDGFGYEMNKSLKNFNYNELDYIVENYLTIEDKLEAKKEQKLEGLTFCVTGKIINKDRWKNRDELSAFIKSLGGKVVTAMSSKVDYLINNDTESSTSKNLKAKQLGKTIINEQLFIDKFDL